MDKQKLTFLIAEKMAQKHYVILNANYPECTWESENENSKQGHIYDEWHRAEIAVEFMAELAGQILIDQGCCGNQKEAMLIWYGLLDPKKEEGKENKSN